MKCAQQLTCSLKAEMYFKSKDILNNKPPEDYGVLSNRILGGSFLFSGTEKHTTVMDVKLTGGTKVNKYIKLGSTILLGLLFLGAAALFSNKDGSVSAQSQVIEAADKSISGKVEYIKVSTSAEDYTVHVRDKIKLVEVSETYLNGQLQNKNIVSEGGKRVTSIGRDHETGKLVGTTWLLPKNIAAENERILKISLLEKQKEELKLKKWNMTQTLKEDGRSLQQVTSEQTDQKEIVYIDELTGLPVKREIYLKDAQGEWKKDTEKIEEYKYFESLPFQFLSIENVEIKERPAPIKEDKIFAG